MRDTSTARYLNDDQLNDLYIQISKRLASGLTKTVVAQRFGISTKRLDQIIKRSHSMAKTDMDTVVRELEGLRKDIRGLKSGAQTHEMQDAQAALIRRLDIIETELRVGKLAE